jgi:hypothetical protein
MRRSKTIRRAALMVGAILATSACFGDFHLSATNLQIGPNPAVPGDELVASVLIALVPTQRHTIILRIDDTEHLRVTSNEAPAIPTLIQMGEASALITQYGVGTHTAYVEVRAEDEDETARTQAVGFELREAVP